MGDWHWQAFAFAMWEKLSGIGWSLALLALFSRPLNFDRPALRWLADRSFGVYVFKAPVIIAFAMLFRSALPYHLYGLFALLTASGVVLSFLIAEAARHIPGLRKII